MKTYNQFINENYNSDRTILDISIKNLKEFPKEFLPLPESLEKLSCYNNQLNSLPDLPKSLKELYCYNNQLNSLPDLPKSLEELYCDNNQLKSLPDLPKSLKILWCDNNPLLCKIPDKFIEFQDKEWLDKYYYKMLNSPSFQMDIVSKNADAYDILKRNGLLLINEIDIKLAQHGFS